MNTRLFIPGSDQIPAELIEAGDKMLRSDFYELIHSVWYEEKLPQQWKGSLSLHLFIKREIKLTIIITEGYHCYQIQTKIDPICLSQG
jgi:hypothetical protein